MSDRLSPSKTSQQAVAIDWSLLAFWSIYFALYFHCLAWLFG
jgi:hypothetical protein